ncbi:MAG: hypothetical protein RL404_1414 [Pseudomonadota bacterium]
MRQLLIAAAIAAMTFAGTLSVPTPVVAAEASAEIKADSEVADIRKLFADYARLMNEKNADAIAEKIYGIPAIYHQPNGDHVAYTDTASLALTWKRYIDAIEAKQGAVTLEITDVKPCLLNQNTAVVTTRSIRTVLKDESAIQSGWLYMLNRKNGQWKISEISARDLDRPLSCP